MKETACYIHIPFCDHKCIYCDFYSIIKYDDQEKYLTTLKKEIKFFADLYRKDRVITTLFFGGGTPSFMNPEYISEIITEIKDRFIITDYPEVTLETNPGTVDKKKLEEFKKIGINRLSVGIQSFNNNELKFLTRIHDRETAVKTIEDAHIAGFDNISIDLIFNLPNQSRENWLSNLKQAVQLPVSHISAYSLILEKGTILNKLVLQGKVKLQDNDYDAELYEATIDFLISNNFQQYEVSNFAKPGYECKHNNAYWQYKDYIGFGTSAHSFINGKRWWNYSSLSFYNNAVNSNGNAIINEEKISGELALNEFVMLALRSSGLDLALIKNNFGNDWINRNKNLLTSLVKKGYLKREKDFIKFTKFGYSLCDEIILKLI